MVGGSLVDEVDFVIGYVGMPPIVVILEWMGIIVSDVDQMATA